MIAPRRLRDLPGFDDALREAMLREQLKIEAGRKSQPYPWHELRDVVIPGLKRISSWVSLDSLALTILCEQMDEDRRPLRIVKAPRPEAANDSEVTP